MNFLGHIFFSNNDHQLMYANLYGDFVKGKDLSDYPEIIRKGVSLHRMIDHYIDHHPAVIELMRSLYDVLPKVSGIAIDLFFDHILAKNWIDYHSTPLKKFVEDFYAAPISFEEQCNPGFLMVIDRMRKKNWLYKYQYDYGLDKACNGVSKRISFPNNLHEGLAIFKKNEKHITHTFVSFMQEAIPHHSDFIQRL